MIVLRKAGKVFLQAVESDSAPKSKEATGYDRIGRG